VLEKKLKLYIVCTDLHHDYMEHLRSLIGPEMAEI